MIQIHQTIKSVCLKSLRLPTVLIIICVAMLIAFPFIDIFHPTKVKNMDSISANEKYINLTVDHLNYSGYDLVSTIGKQYGYYYTLEDEKCTFFLLPISGTPKETFNHYHIKAKVIPYDNSFHDMIESFSKDLNWDQDSLLQITAPYIISNEAYHPVFYAFIFWIVLLIFFVSAKKVIQSLIGYFNPNLYPVCSFLGKAVQQEILTEAQEELSEGTYIQINEMYITENYFIDLGRTKVSVIPLSDIIWCYRLGNLPLNPRNQNHNYSMNFMIRSGSMITITGKTSDEALELINAIRATEYDIIIGHSEAKKRLAKKRCEK